MDKDARKEWRRLVPILLRMRVLTEAGGYVQQSPLLSVVNTCVETITKLCREFGLTPASRSRLQATEPTAEIDPIDAAIS